MTAAEKIIKKHQKRKRSQLINTLNKLEIENCHSCPNRHFDANHNPEVICGGCPAFEQLRRVGNELNQVANIVRLYDLPKELNFKTYEKLRGLEWTKGEIQKHYNLQRRDFDDFVKFHNEGVTI